VATVKELKEDYFHNFSDKFYCTFAQKKHFMFSLNSNYTESGLLENLLSVINSVLPEDQVLLQIALNPVDDKWKEDWAKANIKHKNGEELIVHPSTGIAVAESIIGNVEKILDLVDIVVGVDKKEKEAYERKGKQVDKWSGNVYRNAHMTTQKINGNGFETQIRVYCTSDERTRYYQKIFSGVFKILDAEQELEFTKLGKQKGVGREFISKVSSKNIFSTKELVNFLRLPDRRMQMDFKDNMTSIEITETVIPKELQNGQILIGDATHKGVTVKTYWNTKDYAMATQHRVLVGMQRTGKTSYIKSFAIQAMQAGHSVFVIDTIKMCETANDVRDFLPPEYQDKIVVLDFGNLDYLIPLAWNELLKEQKDKRHRMMISSQIAGNLEAFIETVAGTGTEDKLSPRMKKFLSCSAKIVLSQPNCTIKDVLDVLQEKDIRDDFIERSGLPESNINVQELRRLDDGKGGTTFSLISGISDRYSVMLNDYTMELLLSTKPNPEIDFEYWANNGYCVLIKMSDLKFDRRSLRPLVTFIYSKIWLAMLSRGEQEQPRVTHCILDEIHNFPEVCNMLRLTCRESAKFGLSYTFTNHMLTDLKGLLPTIKSSGANFMLFKTTKENYKMLEQELMEGEVTIEEALQTKKYHSINIVNYDRQYTVFTTKAPDLVSKRFKKYDRSDLDLKHSMKYGTPFED
jgi:predicted kinase